MCVSFSPGKVLSHNKMKLQGVKKLTRKGSGEKTLQGMGQKWSTYNIYLNEQLKNNWNKPITLQILI